MSFRYILLIGLLNLRFLSMCPLNRFRDVNGNCTADRITTSPFSKDVTSIIFQPDVHVILLIVILLIVASNLAVSVVQRCRSQKEFNRPGHEEKAKRESSDLGGTVAETDMNQGAYESPIILTERPEFRVYTELN